MAEAAENANSTPDQPAKGTSMMTLIKIGAFVVVVLSAEALIAFLFIPSAENVNAAAETRFGTDQVPVDPVAALEDAPDGVPMVEVDMKDYTVTAYQPLSNTTLRIDFHLYGTIAEGDQAEFEQLFAKNEQRIREQVIVTIRSSEITDLTDANLGLVKRKLHDKLNRMLGKPLVKSVIVSDFSFVEQ